MNLRLPLACLLLLLMAACKGPLQGVQGRMDAAPGLCAQLLQAYQSNDVEAIVKLGPSMAVIKGIQKAAGTPQGAEKLDYTNPKGQKTMDDSIRVKVGQVLGSAPGSLKAMRLSKVEAGAKLSSPQSPVVYQEQWLVLSGPEGIFRHKVFVMEFMDRLFLCDIGSWLKAEE